MKALTKHRELIFNDLRERKDHPTAKMVFESVRGKADKISFATVYNSLEYLVEHKMVNKLNIESDSVRYDAFLDNHSHLLCTECGKVLDVPPLKLSDDADLQSLGFQVKHVDIVVTGTCSSCHSL
ncbi:transcriptional repressor [Leptospira montravelensis]|uniref:Transcriptional repressor n=1 Tax=Leptospira montravelensis TaxID=2484961 RepID=A0ABY2LSU7_9LEPT|nr:transcriptional repressor [Leptospira montravelensis]TGK83298.1 transcriptional repressor [Leptospira montravelensis]TGL05298.1 transcriptional repressor [Leptospira montravelensis]